MVHDAPEKKRMRFPLRLIPRVIKDEHRYVAQLTREAWRQDQPLCTRCATGHLHRDGRGSHAGLLRCDNCGAIVSLNDLARVNTPWLHEVASERYQNFRKTADILILVTALLVSAGALGSAFVGSVSMFVAVMIFSVPMSAGVCAMRYRAWQAWAGRYYEQRAPFGDWLRAEIAGQVGPKT